MNWIQHPVILEGKKVKLLPLDHAHFPALIHISKQKEIWEFYAKDFSIGDAMLHELQSNMLKRAKKEKYTFTVFDKLQNKIIGATSFINIFPEHRKLEIGWTWYDPAYWGTHYNSECKLLLLTYCFETLKAVRVQLVTCQTNIRSQKAIQKVGGRFEGIQRKERIKGDGTFRDTAIFSIIDDEWEETKKRLIEMTA
jgi:RimJ/RimL family protein N-acetyltransferase